MTEKRVALVVGNSGYRFTAPLKNPVNDATAMESRLRAMGFRVIGGAGKGLDLGIGDFRALLRDFGRALDNADTAMFFYAGHGMQMDGENYLFPIDAAIRTKGEVRRELISLQSVLDDMEHRNRTSLVFLDSCRDNPLADKLVRSMGYTDKRSAAIEDGFAEPKNTSSGTFISYSTRHGQIAYDGDGNHSFYTEALLEMLEQYPTLEIRHLMDHVRHQVEQKTRHKQHGPQIPWEYGSMRPGGFYFVRPAPGVQPPEPVIPVVTLPKTTERDAWNAVKDSNDPDAVAAFLKQYPDGEFAWLAHTLLKGLTEEQEKQGIAIRLAELEKDAEDHWEHVDRYGDDHARKEYFKRYGETQFVRRMLEEKGSFIVQGKLLQLNQPFRDAPHSPELVIIPPGSFLMGSADGQGNSFERPQHEVRMDYPLAVGRFAVTFDEWDHYASKQSGAHKPEDQGWGRGNRPVINVNWDDAKAYVKWLSETTGHSYRLLSESELEYACRAGTSTEYWWGDQISHDQANYSGGGEKTVPADSFKANAFGLYNVHGNVWEWCEDWWHKNYNNAPTDGSAWLEAGGGDSSARVLRGGSWDSNPQRLRARIRSGDNRDSRIFSVGFRVARAL